MKKLFIIRHGKAESWGNSDHQRALHQKGIHQSKFLNSYFKSLSNYSLTSLYSDAKRTSETFTHVSDGIPILEAQVKSEMYAADYMVLFNLITFQTNDSDLILVGHNPGVSRLVEYLTGERYHARTGSMVVIKLPIDKWSEITKESGEFLSEIRYSESD